MNLLVLSGGRHPYEESTPILGKFLKAAGHEVTITEDSSILSDETRMSRYQVLVFNTLREGEATLTNREQKGIERFIASGNGFVCIHISGCAPDSWPEYHDITGGGWIMSRSFHPPYGKFTVTINNKNHPGVTGISDFHTNDELYMGIEFKDGNDVFLTADADAGTYPWRGEPTTMPGGTFPLGWTRTYGKGRVFTTLLGHNGLSFETPEFQKIVLNGIQWSGSKS